MIFFADIFTIGFSYRFGRGVLSYCSLFDILMALLLGTAAILAGGGGGYDLLVLGAVITLFKLLMVCS